MKKTYHGACHCGAIRYDADIDLSAGTTRCNCTYCRKLRNWGAAADAATFHVTAGEDQLRRYEGRGDGTNYHAFCGRCGIRLFARGNIAELGGEFVSIAISTLEDVAEAELIASPITWCDGLHDNWWNPPAEVRHL